MQAAGIHGEDKSSKEGLELAYAKIVEAFEGMISLLNGCLNTCA